LAIALVILSVTLHYRVLTSIIAAIGAVILISYHILAFVQAKKDIVKGTTEELRGLLQSKLPHGKYILCK